MPPNELCPHCLAVLPDWHLEWHTLEDQARIFRGDKGMVCPCCRTVVLFVGYRGPLTLPPQGNPVGRVERVALRAASWALDQQTTTLEHYLQTVEGSPYKGMWTAAQVQEADRQAAQNP
jgi:hypothetical protein